MISVTCLGMLLPWAWAAALASSRANRDKVAAFIDPSSPSPDPAALGAACWIGEFNDASVDLDALLAHQVLVELQRLLWRIGERCRNHLDVLAGHWNKAVADLLTLLKEIRILRH